MSATQYGLNLESLLKEYRIDPELLGDPYARVPHTLVSRLWDEIPKRSGDAAFGLHCAERWHGRADSAFDQAFYNSSTMGDALNTLLRFGRLLHEAAINEREYSDDILWVSQRFQCTPDMPRQFCEMVLGMWVLRMRQILSRPVALHAVTLCYPAPADASEHHKIFGPHLHFGADRNAIAFEAALLDAPVKNADGMLGLVLKRHLQDELARLPPPPDDFLQSAQHEIREVLVDPALDIDHLARRMRTSRRTLQRRLQNEGTSFQDLLDKTRREEVLRHLSDLRLTLAEIAFMTGYGEMSSFYRAFRRWTGQTPKEYRSVQMAQAR